MSIRPGLVRQLRLNGIFDDTQRPSWISPWDLDGADLSNVEFEHRNVAPCTSYPPSLSYGRSFAIKNGHESNSGCLRYLPFAGIWLKVFRERTRRVVGIVVADTWETYYCAACGFYLRHRPLQLQTPRRASFAGPNQAKAVLLR